MDKDRWVELVFGGVIAAATICNVYVVSNQWSVMDRQLNEAANQRKVTEAQLRANLRREKPALTPFADGQRINLKEGDNFIGWHVNPQWTNIGSTDAKEVTSYWDIKVLPLTTETNGKINVECPRPEKPDRRILPSVLARDELLTELSKPLMLEDARMAAGAKPTHIIFIFGHMQYRDIFDDKREHRRDWCLIAMPNDLNSGTFSFLRARDEVD